MASSDSQIDKPQRGRPKRAELPDVNINTGVQSINTESFFKITVTFVSAKHKLRTLAEIKINDRHNFASRFFNSNS